MPTTTTVTLPYEIWYIIASLFSLSELRNLLGVHAAFLYRFMKLQYVEVKISSIHDPVTLRCYKNMSPMAAKHVRTLVLEPEALGGFMYKGITGSIARLTHDLLTKCNIGVPLSKAAAAGKLLDLIPHMTNVESLVINNAFQQEHNPLFEPATTLVRTSLSSQGQNLRKLSLKSPYIEFLDPSLVLPALEDLNVSFNNPAPIDAENTHPLISFFSRHAHQLKHVSIYILLATLDTSYLFTELPNLPRLNSIYLAVTREHIASQQPTGIDEFLKKHAPTLEKMKLLCSCPHRRNSSERTSSTSTQLLSHPIFQVELPVLSSLDLGFVELDHSHDFTPLRRYLGNFRLTLTTLALDFNSYHIPYDRVGDVFRAFLGSEKPPLQHLTIRTDYLMINVLDEVENHFPNLSELDWTVRYFRDYSRDLRHASQHFYNLCPSDGVGVQAQHFASDLGQRSFEGLPHLRHLTIRHLADWKRRDEEIESIFQRALPPHVTVSIVQLPRPVLCPW
ncbi:hypothetical protein CPC08DRAFT_760119 [Agrocybe pediades]|nr:hypothetical protein CPC08DRAFT_760119 [Agrocybe pediades]